MSLRIQAWQNAYLWATINEKLKHGLSKGVAMKNDKTLP